MKSSIGRFVTAIGDVGIFNDGSGFVVGEVIDRTRCRLCVAWGDCHRWLDVADVMSGPRKDSLPSMHTLFGKRFDTAADLLAAIRDHVRPGVPVTELQPTQETAHA